jgi:hypothetical protein
MAERCKSFAEWREGRPVSRARQAPAMQIEGGRYAELHNVLAVVPDSIALAYRLRHSSDPRTGPAIRAVKKKSQEVAVQNQLSTSLPVERCPHCAIVQPQLARVHRAREPPARYSPELGRLRVSHLRRPRHRGGRAADPMHVIAECYPGAPDEPSGQVPAKTVACAARAHLSAPRMTSTAKRPSPSGVMTSRPRA